MALEGFNRIARIAFLQGFIDGVTLYAVWKDGEQVVGCMQTPLKTAIARYKTELDLLLSMPTVVKDKVDKDG
jgi:hypothetical protein